MASRSSRLPKLKLKNILSLLGLFGLCIVVLLTRHQLTSFWQLLHELRWYILASIVAVQIVSYWLNGLYYKSILRIFSYNIDTVRLFEGALATNFVNYIVPSIGLAGAGYLSQVLSPEVSRGEAFLVQLMRYALSALAVLIMMPLGFLIIFFSHNSDHSIVTITLVSAIAITALAFCLVGLISQETLLRKLVKWVYSWLGRFLPKHIGESAILNFINEFYVGFRSLTINKHRILIPFAWSIVYIIVEISTFYLAFLAFGRVENLGIVIMAYLFANIASILGGAIFSIGTFEVGMAGTLVALGVPFTFAFSVTIVYRMLNLLIGLPPGYYYYKKYLRKIKI